jgi:hypothetical protein
MLTTMRGADSVVKRTILFRVLPGNAITNIARVPQATPELRHALEAQFGFTSRPDMPPP